MPAAYADRAPAVVEDPEGTQAWVFEGNRYLADSPKYKAVGVLGMDLGLEWGGSWKTIVDQPHFQLRPAWAMDLSERDMLAEMRSRQAAGGPVFA